MNDQLGELLFRVFNDPRPDIPPDAAYLFGQTVDNQESSFDAAARSAALELLILDTQPRSGYPGYAAWRAELVAGGYNGNRIQAVPMDDDLLLNSRTESIAAIDYSMKQGLTSLEVIAPPFHLPRAFMTMITIALERGADIALHSHAGKAFSWNETATHSQGELEATRAGLIHTELERIATYQAKGDLAATADILDYLNTRRTA